MRVGANRRQNKIKFKKLSSLRNNTLCQHYCAVSEIIGRVCFFSPPPSSQVFPHGLPEEFTLVFTLALKKAALGDTVYLLQISDQQGYPQVLLNTSAPPYPPPFRPLHRRFFPLFLISCPSLFCIRVHFHPPFIFSPDTFSIPSLWRGVFCALPSIIFGFSSFIHLHCYSCASDDGALESQRVPIITESLRPDLNTQCV